VVRGIAEFAHGFDSDLPQRAERPVEVLQGHVDLLQPRVPHVHASAIVSRYRRRDIEEKHARGHEIEPGCFPRGEAATLGLGPLPDVVFPALVNRLAEEPPRVLDMNSGTFFVERGDIPGREESGTRRKRFDGLFETRLQDAPDFAAGGKGLRIDLTEGQARLQLVRGRHSVGLDLDGARI
jgi:hypothetical protein